MCKHFLVWFFLLLLITLSSFSAPNAYAEKFVILKDGTIVYPDKPVEKYMELDKCVVGNTEDVCRDQWVKKETNRAMELSKKKNDIILITWLEETDEKTDLASAR